MTLADNMKQSLRLLLMGFMVSSFLVLTGCGKPKFHSLEGSTMGTTYHITAQMPSKIDPKALQTEIDARLVAINNSMSTYKEESEINAFNRLPVGKSMTFSGDFIQVVTLAKKIYKASDGAFDPTVGTLVDLWGFGGHSAKQGILKPPTQTAIDQARAYMGFDKVVITGDSLKKTGSVTLDFSGIAKGYAVDQIANLLRDKKINNFLVEIGGEIATQGLSPRAGSWRIAINAPKSSLKEITRLDLQDANMATSGDYRNYFEYKGKRYSHTINPKTGYPINHNLHSVTVLTTSVAAADAWATALLVLGENTGFKMAEKQNLAVYMIYYENGAFEMKYTDPMKMYFPQR